MRIHLGKCPTKDEVVELRKLTCFQAVRIERLQRLLELEQERVMKQIRLRGQMLAERDREMEYLKNKLEATIEGVRNARLIVQEMTKTPKCENV